MKIALSTTELASLRRRCHHRLHHCPHLLGKREFAFLTEMLAKLGYVKALTERQLAWLLAILLRTKTKWGR